MTPPLNIDGSQVSAVTIDGQNVSQITIDGQEVLSAIPDSVTNQWPMDEGSGTLASDTVGSVSLSLYGANWQTDSTYEGGYSTSYDGTDDYYISDSAFGVTNSQFTAMQWFNINSVPDDYGTIFIAKDGKNSDHVDGWSVYHANTSHKLRLSVFDGGSRTDAIDTNSVSYPAGEDVFVALVGDGSSHTLYAYDSTQQLGSASGSGSRGTSEANLIGMASTGNYSTGLVDSPVVSTTTAMSQSDIEEVWQQTGPNA